jgi:hypothetical protein
MKEVGFVMDGKLYIAELLDGKPCIVRRGGPLPQEIPSEFWMPLKEKYTGPFHCAAYAEGVLAFRLPEGAVGQLCKCLGVVHLCPETVPPYRTSTDWDDFRALLAQEMLDPARPHYIRNDHLSGKPMRITSKGMAWVRRKLGLPDDVDISDDGTILTIQGIRESLHIDPASGVCSMIVDSQDGQSS